MSEHRTHGADSAIDDEEEIIPVSMLRQMCVDSMGAVRAPILAMPESASRSDFLTMMDDVEDFWRNQASDHFCRQFLFVALGNRNQGGKQ